MRKKHKKNKQIIIIHFFLLLNVREMQPRCKNSLEVHTFWLSSHSTLTFLSPSDKNTHKQYYQGVERFKAPIRSQPKNSRRQRTLMFFIFLKDPPELAKRSKRCQRFNARHGRTHLTVGHQPTAGGQ